MDAEKNGTFILSDHSTRDDIEPHFPEINALWEEQCPGNENDENRCPTNSPSTSSEQAESENDSALNAASRGQAEEGSGSRGNGT
jgi:hypothetical protein